MNAKTSAPSLFDLQNRFQKTLRNSSGLDEALAAEKGAARILNWILEDSSASARERLAVYYDAYFLRLLDSLAHDFPTLKKVLGNEDFQRLCADYLGENPSRFKSLSLVGQRLPDFIREHPLSRKFYFLADLARLEWAVLLSLYSDRSPTADFTKASPSSILRLNSSAQFLETEWAVERLWENREKPTPQSPRILRKKEPRTLIIFRDASWARVKVLSLAEFSALRLIQEGVALKSLCQRLENFPGPKISPERARKWFQNWARLGMIGL